jgi:hypothetical protein
MPNNKLLSSVIRKMHPKTEVFLGEAGSAFLRGKTKSGLDALVRIQRLDDAFFDDYEHPPVVYAGVLEAISPPQLISCQGLPFNALEGRLAAKSPSRRGTDGLIFETEPSSVPYTSLSVCLGQSLLDNSAHIYKVATRDQSRPNLENPWISEVVWRTPEGEDAGNCFAFTATDGHRLTAHYALDRLEEWGAGPAWEQTLLCTDHLPPGIERTVEHLMYFPAELLSVVSGPVIDFGLQGSKATITALVKGWAVTIRWEDSGGLGTPPPGWMDVIPKCGEMPALPELPLGGKPPPHTKGKNHEVVLMSDPDGIILEAIAFLDDKSNLLATLEGDTCPLPEGAWRFARDLTVSTKYMHGLMATVKAYVKRAFTFQTILPDQAGREDFVQHSRTLPMRVDITPTQLRGCDLLAQHLIMPMRAKDKSPYIGNYADANEEGGA